jgi:hypothetical protein
MPTIEDLQAELEGAGIEIEGKNAVRVAAAVAGANWPAAFVGLVQKGPMYGVQLTIRTDVELSTERLDGILSGYPFAFDQKRILMGNIAPSKRAALRLIVNNTN